MHLNDFFGAPTSFHAASPVRNATEFVGSPVTGERSQEGKVPLPAQLDFRSLEAELRRELQTYQRELMSARKDLVASRARGREAEERFQTELSDLSSKLQQLYETVEAEQDYWQADREEMQALLDEERRRADELHASLLVAQGREELVRTEVRSGQEQVMGLDAALVDSLCEKDQLEGEAALLENTVLTLQARLREQAEKRKRLGARQRQLEDALQKSEIHIQDYEAWSGNIHGELQEAMAEFQQSNVVSARERATLQMQIEALEQQVQLPLSPPSGETAPSAANFEAWQRAEDERRRQSGYLAAECASLVEEEQHFVKGSEQLLLHEQQLARENHALRSEILEFRSRRRLHEEDLLRESREEARAASQQRDRLGGELTGLRARAAKLVNAEAEVFSLNAELADSERTAAAEESLLEGQRREMVSMRQRLATALGSAGVQPHAASLNQAFVR